MAEPLVLLHGDDPWLVFKAAQQLRAELAATLDSDLELEELHGASDLAAIERSLTSPPFLSARRVVFLWDPPQAGGRATSQSDALAAILGKRSDTTAVVLVVRSNLASTSSLLKGVRTARGEVRQFVHPKGRELCQHVQTRVRESGLSLGALVIEKLTVVAARDLGQLDGELEKLSVYSGSAGKVADGPGMALVSSVPETELYKLTDAIFEKPGSVGGRLAEVLAKPGMQPHAVIGAVARVCRDLLALSDPDLTTQSAGMPQWRREKLSRHLARVGKDLLQEWLVNLADLDLATRAGDVEPVPGLDAVISRMAADVQGVMTHRPGPARRPPTIFGG